MTKLDKLEIAAAAARRLRPVADRRPKRRADGTGALKCRICKLRIRGKYENHVKGDHHQKALATFVEED